MGLVSPFVLLGKQILQEACSLGLDLDAPLPTPLIERHNEWFSQLSLLSEIRIERCLKPLDFIVSSVEFHHFSDASVSGYGVCSYLRLIDSFGNVSLGSCFLNLVCLLSSQ